jgi:PKD repeat protein
VAAFNATPTTGCAPLTVNFTDSSTGSPTSWNWTFGDGGTSTLQSPSHDYTSAGNYTVSLTVSNDCGSNTTTKANYITVYAKPAATASSNSPVCEGSTIELTGGPDGMTTYGWTGPNGFSSSLQSPTIPNATLAMAGNYTLTVTNSNGCAASNTTSVVVNAKPTCYISADPGSEVCAGNNVTLTENGGDAVSWLWTTAETTSSIVVSASGTYGVTITDGNGCTSYCEIEITVYAQPVATASSNSPVSQGATIELYGGPDGMASYNWTGPNSFTSSLQNATIPNATTAMAGTYTLTVINGNGCSDVATTNVVVQVPPSTPTVTTQAATGVTTSSATPYMNYTMGNSTSVDVRFAYKKSTSSAWSYTDWVTKSADGTYTVSLTGLSSNTKYDLKAELKYASTVIESAILQFTTAISALPPSQGCFIATAAYGTPTAKQIDVLREFRDVVLLKSTVGSQFVALYYRLSPPIANFIAGNEILRTLVRELLVDPIVRTIEATGDIWRN